VRFENEVSVRAPVTRLRLWWNDAFWVIPLTGLVVALAVDAVVDNADEAFADSIDDFALLSPSSAATLFASVGGGMVTFTGFVFSVVLLIIQFGSSSYSPRTVAYFLRSRVTQSVLAVFVGTIAYAFLALISIGSAGRDTYVPFFGVFVCLLFLAASLVAFLVLIQHVAGRIRVDALLTNLGTLARRAIARDLVGGGPEKASVLDDVPTLDSAATTVRHRGKSGQIVAIDTHLAQRLAAATGVEVIFDVRVGDGISPGTPVASVRAATSDERFNRCVLGSADRPPPAAVAVPAPAALRGHGIDRPAGRRAMADRRPAGPRRQPARVSPRWSRAAHGSGGRPCGSSRPIARTPGGSRCAGHPFATIDPSRGLGFKGSIVASRSAPETSAYSAAAWTASTTAATPSSANRMV
jgi:hypothetical protein